MPFGTLAICDSSRSLSHLLPSVLYCIARRSDSRYFAVILQLGHITHITCSLWQH